MTKLEKELASWVMVLVAVVPFVATVFLKESSMLLDSTKKNEVLERQLSDTQAALQEEKAWSQVVGKPCK